MTILPQPQFLCIGHRGAKGYEPENTISSFRKAFECGASWIECDVWNVENTPVVFHDHRLERLTNGIGLVEEASLRYLRSLDAGRGERVPLLREVLDLIGVNNGINIELKGSGTALTVTQVLAEYATAGKLRYDQILVSSFNHRELAEVKKLILDLRTGILIVGVPLNIAAMAAELGAYSVHQSLEFVSEQFVEEAHGLGLKVYVYTVNHEDDLRRMFQFRVDGVFSDFPDIALKLTSG